MSTGSTRDINVTPLIDVLLVLLIIFLVMIPVMMRMHSVDLPDSRDTSAVPAQPPVMVTLNADLTATIDDGPALDRGQLLAQLRLRLRTANVVFVDFVAGTPWREVIGTVDAVRGLSDDSALKVALKMRDGTR